MIGERQDSWCSLWDRGSDCEACREMIRVFPLVALLINHVAFGWIVPGIVRILSLIGGQCAF